MVRLGRPATVVLAITLVIALAMVVHARWREAAVLERIEGATLDARFALRGPIDPGGDLLILGIDDRAIDAAGRWPLPRRVIAETVERLEAMGASVVVLDLLILEPEPAQGEGLAEGDMALIEAARRADHVILPMAFTFGEPARPDPAQQRRLESQALRVVRDGGGGQAGLLQPSGVRMPFAALADEAALAHANVFVEQGGELRRFHPVLRHGANHYPALVVETVRRHLGLPRDAMVLRRGEALAVGDIVLPLDHAGRTPINFYGRTGTFETRSLADLLAGGVDAANVAGRVVLVGAIATGVGDHFRTPYQANLPGTEVFATLIDNMLTGRVLGRDDRTVLLDLAMIIGFGGLAGLLALPMPTAVFVIGVVTALMAPFGVGLAAFIAGPLWVNVTLPTLAVLLVALVAGVVRFVRSEAVHRAGAQKERLLGRYLSPLILERIAAGRDAAGEERTQPATILFVDMRGYTTASETLRPAESMALLRRFHHLVEACALEHGGVLATYMGDGVMVIFGVPDPSLEAPVQALACARALLERTEAWRAEVAERGQAPVSIGVGLNHGAVQIGHVGGAHQQQYTAIGDTVNVAARLEAATRAHDADLLVAHSVVEAVKAMDRNDLLQGLTRLEPIPVKGRAEPVAAWALPRSLG